jgi:Asp-tRNA(Asn)/Glu-tRNA(Gln) amidotransferase A subunit family amidase
MRNQAVNVPKLGRRTWLKLLPAIATVAGAGLPAVARAQSPAAPPATPPKISKEKLQQALELIGLQFTDAQIDVMLPGVNRNLASYENLRKIDVPLDTEPAFHFVPLPPGKPLPEGPAKFFLSRPPAVRRWKEPDDLAFLPVTQLSHLIRTRQITPNELTKMYLQRLKTFAPKLNCVITLTEDLALEQAARATSEIKAGKYRGSLHGIPYGAKDLFATKGIPTTWGAEPYQNQVPDYDATVIQRLGKAGAILLAKLSMGALAQGGLWFGGMTKTPWDYEQTSSGSSAGSASATSAGLVGFSIGTETLGSIVSPSTRCGVAGVRPTYGRVSRYGAMGLSWTMDKIGPICRSVEDCALVLRAIAGSDNRDITVRDAPVNWNARLPISTLKVGYLKDEFDKMDKDLQAIYNPVLDKLREAGADLKPMQLPEFPLGALRTILVAEAAAAFDDLTRSGGVDQLKGQAPNDWPNTFRTARTQSAVEYIRAQRIRTLLIQSMDKLMSEWDVFVSPPFSASLTATNLTGHPQVVVPCGFNKGLPQSILFTGRLYEEGTAMRLAHAFEQSTEWHTMHPKLTA